MKLSYLVCFILFVFTIEGQQIQLRQRSQLLGKAQLRGGEPSILTNNMIACWPLDEATGIREDDFGTFDLTDNNTVTGTTGPVGLGNASSFAQANSESLSHADHASLRMGSFNTTFAIWSNVTDSGRVNTIMKKDDNMANHSYILTHDGPNNRFEWAVTDNMGAAKSVLSGSIAEGTGWHFIVCGYDSGNTRIFMSVDDGTVNTTAMPNPPNAGTDTFYFGEGYTAGTWFNGGLAGGALWNRLLTAAEITTLYASGNGTRACDEPGN